MHRLDMGIAFRRSSEEKAVNPQSQIVIQYWRKSIHPCSCSRARYVGLGLQLPFCCYSLEVTLESWHRDLDSLPLLLHPFRTGYPSVNMTQLR